MPLVQAELHFSVHEDGMLEVLSPWFPIVVFPESWVASSDGRRLTLRGDELTIYCSNGGAVYCLGPLLNGTRAGRLIRSWSR